MRGFLLALLFGTLVAIAPHQVLGACSVDSCTNLSYPYKKPPQTIGPFSRDGRLVFYYSSLSGSTLVRSIKISWNDGGVIKKRVIDVTTPTHYREITPIFIKTGDYITVESITENMTRLPTTYPCAPDQTSPPKCGGYIGVKTNTNPPLYTCGSGMKNSENECVPFTLSNVVSEINWAKSFGDTIVEKQCWNDWMETKADLDFNDFLLQFGIQPYCPPPVVNTAKMCHSSNCTASVEADWPQVTGIKSYRVQLFHNLNCPNMTPDADIIKTPTTSGDIVQMFNGLSPANSNWSVKVSLVSPVNPSICSNVLDNGNPISVCKNIGGPVCTYSISGLVKQGNGNGIPNVGGTNATYCSDTGLPQLPVNITVSGDNGLSNDSDNTTMPSYSLKLTCGPPLSNVNTKAANLTANLPSGYQFTCPLSGAYLNMGQIGDRVNVNFYAKAAATSVPWWQAVGGDVLANSGGIESVIPIATPPKLLIQPVPMPGVVALKGGLANLVLGSGQVGIPAWQILMNPLQPYKMENWEGYEYFKKLLGAEGRPNIGVVSPLDKPESGIYYLVNGATPVVAGVGGWQVTGDQKITIIVNGDLIVTNDMKVATGGFLAFFVKGNITVQAGVSQLQGIYVADGPLTILAGTGQLRGEGIFVGWGGVNLHRDLGNLNNQTIPAELFTYRPDLLLNAQKEFRKSIYNWSEIAP